MRLLHKLKASHMTYTVRTALKYNLIHAHDHRIVTELKFAFDNNRRFNTTSNQRGPRQKQSSWHQCTQNNNRKKHWKLQTATSINNQQQQLGNI